MKARTYMKYLGLKADKNVLTDIPSDVNKYMTVEESKNVLRSIAERNIRKNPERIMETNLYAAFLNGDVFAIIGKGAGYALELDNMKMKTVRVITENCNQENPDTYYALIVEVKPNKCMMVSQKDLW